MSSREHSASRPPSGSRNGSRKATMAETRSQLGRLLAEVEAGETVIITRHGRPVAALGPLPTRSRPTFGAMRGRVGFDETFYDPLPEDELRAWQGT